MISDCAHMVMIFLDGNDARHTNVGAVMETDAKTIAAFRSYRYMEVPRDKATFLLDLHDASGDIIGTIMLDDRGFSAISNEPVKTAEEYRKIDAAYWVEASAKYELDKIARTPPNRAPEKEKCDG